MFVFVWLCLAHPIRALLAFSGVAFEDVLYTTDDSWYSVKHELGLDFPNLPYWIEGDIQLTQSGAILRFLAERHGLVGATPAQRAHVNMLEGFVGDFRSALVKLVYGTSKEDFPKAQEAFLADKATPFVNAIEGYLARNGGPFLVGAGLTLPDFILFEMLDELRHMIFPHPVGGPFANQPFVQNFLNAYESIPALRAFMSSAAHVNVPFNGEEAAFR
jgi:glutathione S-transferase